MMVVRCLFKSQSKSKRQYSTVRWTKKNRRHQQMSLLLFTASIRRPPVRASVCWLIEASWFDDADSAPSSRLAHNKLYAVNAPTNLHSTMLTPCWQKQGQ